MARKPVSTKKAIPKPKPKNNGKHPGGRPPTSLTSYKPEYCELLMKHMAEGYGFQCFGITLDPLVHHGITEQWLKIYPEFAEAKKNGDNLCLRWWETLGRAGAAGKLKNFNAATWIFNMKNRFLWRDRQDITSGDSPIRQVFKINGKEIEF